MKKAREDERTGERVGTSAAGKARTGDGSAGGVGLSDDGAERSSSVGRSGEGAGLVMSPAGSAWGGLIREWRARAAGAAGDRPSGTRVGVRLDAAARARFRAELGLPAQGPVVMSGHQAVVWHAGILAKYVAAAEAARALGAAGAWLVVDHDVADGSRVRYPDVDGEGRPLARVWDMRQAEGARGLGDKAGGEGDGDVPACNRPALRPGPAPSVTGPGVPESVGTGLRRIGAAVSAAAGAASEAEQVGRAVVTLAAGLCPSLPLVFARELARTALFAEVVRAMAADPARCARSYNAAVREAGATARLGALDESDRGGRGVELPLWRLPRRAGAPRERVRAAMAGAGLGDAGELAPRALLMTGLLRAAGCDLFIHGTGGGGEEGYDRVTERWLAEWLGWELCPAAVVSATLRLRLAGTAGDASELAGAAGTAAWRAHRARHDPDLLGDSEAAARQRELVAAIARAEGRERAPLFAELHALLDRVRARHAEELATLDAAARRARGAARGAAVLLDRTWAFPLHGAERLEGLAAAVRAGVGQ